MCLGPHSKVRDTLNDANVKSLWRDSYTCAPRETTIYAMQHITFFSDPQLADLFVYYRYYDLISTRDIT